MRPSTPFLTGLPSLALGLGLGLGLATTAFAQASSTQAPTTQASLGDYFDNWYTRVDQAQSSQPHWMTPLVTITPRLEEEVRTDFYYQRAGNGFTSANYGNGKGLELIPSTTEEIIINAPTYTQRWGEKPIANASGWNDYPFMLIKQRLASANEQNGNYIVTLFLGVQAPMGIPRFTNDAWIITPTIAAGKGWGDFDIQETLSAAMPTNYSSILGTAITSNTTFQYHLLDVLWPEVEVNWTNWVGGLRTGKNQVFITPGIIFGRFPITERLKLIVGVGYQASVAPKLTTSPVLTPVYNNAWIATTRITF